MYTDHCKDNYFALAEIELNDRVRVYGIKSGQPVFEGRLKEAYATLLTDWIVIESPNIAIKFSADRYCFLGPGSLKHLDEDSNQAE